MQDLEAEEEEEEDGGEYGGGSEDVGYSTYEEEEEEEEAPPPPTPQPPLTRGRARERQDETPAAAASASRTPSPTPSTSSVSSSSSVNDVAKRTLRYHIRAVESHNKNLRVKAAIKRASTGGEEEEGGGGGGGGGGGRGEGQSTVTPPPCWGPVYSKQEIAVGQGEVASVRKSTRKRQQQQEEEGEGGGGGGGRDDAASFQEEPRRPTTRATSSSSSTAVFSTPQQQPPPRLPPLTQQAGATTPAVFQPSGATTTGHKQPRPSSSSSSQQNNEEEKEVLIQNEWIEGATSVIGTCYAMCPDDEIAMREVGRNKLEDRPGVPPTQRYDGVYPPTHLLTTHPPTYPTHSMIKDLERNPPADYPVSKIRPVEWLLRSVEYMEDELMDKGRPGQEAGTEGRVPLDRDRSWGQASTLENYKFHFQRLRMVAKELIMQVGLGGWVGG